MWTRHSFRPGGRRWIGLVMIAALMPAQAAARRDDSGDRQPRDPLISVIHRIDQYVQRHEVDGVLLDPRVVVNATEAARLSVVPQLLAYAELNRVFPRSRLRRDIAQRADFLLDRAQEFRSGSVFDGMLGYGFLEAYEATGDARYLSEGTAIVDELKAIPHTEYILNGGLMAAMAFAKYYRVTGDAESEQLTREVLSSLPAYQHADGSFPHWCPGSTDIHYTGWMSSELILIERLLDDPRIDPMLQRMRVFMEGRLDGRGVTRYEERCPDYPGCVVSYYSIGSGCWFDYDTRGFTNELGYSALLFDHFGSPAYRAVMGFLGTLERRGTYPDKWDYWPPPDDPYFVWTDADTSVVNTSLIFWSLTSALSGRRERIPLPIAWAEDWDREPVVGVVGVPAPAEISHHSAPRWTRVDSLLIAGVDPAAFCDPPASDVTLRERRPGERPRRPSRRPDPGAANAATPATILRFESTSGARAVRFTLSGPGRISVEVFDAAGRRIRELFSGPAGGGEHAVYWDGVDLAGRECPSGVYFARLLAGREQRSARLLLLR